MAAPADIIAFCKDWNEPKTSNNHILEEMAKRHRVLWVNSIATRAPRLGSAHDWRKMVRKLRAWLAGPQLIHDRLRVLTPLVVPLPRSALAQRINRWLTGLQVRQAARRWGLHRPQLWIFPPNAVDYVGQFGESKVIYYCVDEWSQFTHLDADFILAKERQLLEKADVVFVVSRKLLAKHPRAHLIPHGVHFDLFAAPGPVAADLPPKPVIGFYGNLYDWVDQDLLAGIAARRPQWSVVLIGKIMTDVSRLRAPNIYLLGPRPYEELPAYCRGFDVGIIPYRRDDPRMESVNPLKLREFLAAGLPVVSVDIPEVRDLPVRLANTVDEFVARIEDCLADPTDYRDSVRHESWAARAAEIERILGE